MKAGEVELLCLCGWAVCFFVASTFGTWIGRAGQFLFAGAALIFVIGQLLAHRKTRKGRLGILERQHKRGSVTPEEYAAKRQEILKDL
jgi:hypothetical protein